jgi:hypothetical protein
MAATHLSARLAADVGLVGLHRAAARAQERSRLIGHCETETLCHDPRRLVGHANDAVNLVAADALLRGTKQVRRQHPLVQRDPGTLKNGAHGHGELRTAVSAEPEARTVGLAAKPAIALCAAAMRAYRAIQPAQVFEVFSGGVFVTESGGVEHGEISYG